VVTVLPSLRASGLGLIDAEAPGMGVDRLAPRVKDTATRFWKLYTGLTALIAVGLLAAGMGPFDAIAHALTTASTGGFSTRDASIGHWDSLSVELVLVVAMVLGAANFTLHWRSLASRRIVHFRDHEFRGYLTILGVGTLLVAGMLAIDGMGVGRALRMGVFNVVTLGTSSGFGNATGAGSGGDFVRWTAGPQMILLFLMVFGGCAGSTAGGVKVVRLRVGMSHAYRTLRGFRRPRALFPVRQGARTVPEAIVERIAGFMVVYGMLVVVGTVAVTALGTDLVTAVGGVIGALGNMGPALGDVGPADSFVDGFSTPARMVLAVLMLVGRLEIFPMLLMLVAPYRSLRGAGRSNRP
jgi:trk system potassium uptake protein TrkH